ncbi:MAG: PIG-L deacetylase family protein [Chloroflexota bacterium]
MMAENSLPHISEDWDRAMCIVAHPDDIEYGTASAVARWVAAGKDVVYVLASRGEAGIESLPPEQTGPLREREQRAAAKAVGVDVVEFLDHVDGVIEYGQPLRRDLARMIRTYKPQVIVTQNTDLTRRGGILNQADHRAVGLASLDAARDAGNRWIFPELLAAGLEPWTGVKLIFIPGVHDADHWCDTSAHMDAGIAALAAHADYLGNLSEPMDVDAFLRKPAGERGAQFGVDYAVVFKVWRV